MTNVSAPARSTMQMLDLDPTEAPKPAEDAGLRETHRLAEMFRLEPTSSTVVQSSQMEVGAKLLTT